MNEDEVSTLNTEEIAGVVPINSDEALLRKLGYRQDLSRSISAFGNFAIAFSCCSVLSGLAPLWGNTMVYSGPLGVIWGWVITSVMTTIVACCLAEICSAYPTTGGLYFWVSQLATAEWVPLACWLTGWYNWIGGCFGIAGTDIGLAQFIVAMIKVWQPDVDISVYVQYGIIVGIFIIHGTINSVAVNWAGIVNQGAFFANMLGILLTVAVSLAITRPLASSEWVFTQLYNNSGFDNNGYAFLLVILSSQYTLTGCDSAAHMSEETKSSQKGSPSALLTAVVSNAVSGFIFLIGVGFMVQNYDEQILSENAISPQIVQVFLDGVGGAWTVVFVVFVIISIFFSGSALTLSSSRMVYAFARDGAMPFSKQLHTLNKRTNAPVMAVWFNILVATIVGILYMINETAYSSIVAVNTIGSQLSYLVPILLRITTSRKSFQPGPWHLGRFSVPMGIIACLWILFTCGLFIAPTSSPVTPGNMNYAIVPFSFIMILSTGYYLIWGRKWFRGPVREIDDKQVILQK
ncbi:amino acid/polyamine transporter I [Gongronella butleri]|nr:amino acid/polyamine transporter I [Gongronella butleri]